MSVIVANDSSKSIGTLRIDFFAIFFRLIKDNESQFPRRAPLPSIPLFSPASWPRRLVFPRNSTTRLIFGFSYRPSRGLHSKVHQYRSEMLPTPRLGPIIASAPETISLIIFIRIPLSSIGERRGDPVAAVIGSRGKDYSRSLTAPIIHVRAAARRS